MELSSTSSNSRWMSRSEYVSTLLIWRRYLAMLNWRPVYEIEMRELESKKRSQQLEFEIEQLKQTNKQLAVIEQRTLALLLNANSSLQKHQEVDSSSTNQ
jgi:hypothetical protein